MDYQKELIDLDTLKAVAANRMNVMSRYSRDVIMQVCKEEKAKADLAGKRILRRGRKFLIRHHLLLDDKSRQRLDAVLAESQALKVVYDFSQRLQLIWHMKTVNQDTLIQSLQDWCHHAEQTGIEALQEFARTIKAYRLQEV